MTTKPNTLDRIARRNQRAPFRDLLVTGALFLSTLVGGLTAYHSVSGALAADDNQSTSEAHTYANPTAHHAS